MTFNLPNCFPTGLTLAGMALVLSMLCLVASCQLQLALAAIVSQLNDKSMADVQSLWHDANCFVSCAANKFSIEVIKAVLLKQILLNLNPNAVVDAASLVAQGACFICYASNEFSLQAIQAVLFNQILAAETTACIIGGVGPPTVAVPCAFSVYVQQPGPNFGLWLGDKTTGVWGNIVAQGP